MAIVPIMYFMRQLPGLKFVDVPLTFLQRWMLCVASTQRRSDHTDLTLSVTSTEPSITYGVKRHSLAASHYKIHHSDCTMKSSVTLSLRADFRTEIRRLNERG